MVTAVLINTNISCNHLKLVQVYHFFVNIVSNAELLNGGTVKY